MGAIETLLILAPERIDRFNETAASQAFERMRRRMIYAEAEKA